MKRTILDSSVLIAACREADSKSKRQAERLLDDLERVFVGTPYLRLETLPKPRFNGYEKEVALLKVFFEEIVEEWVQSSPDLSQEAMTLAERHGLSAMDALHVAAALRTSAEFVTLENPSGPLSRVTEVSVTFL